MCDGYSQWPLGQEYIVDFCDSACVLSDDVSYTLLSIIEVALRIYMSLLLLLILLAMLIVMSDDVSYALLIIIKVALRIYMSLLLRLILLVMLIVMNGIV